MRNWDHLVAELLYGAALLAVITAAPEIVIKLRVNHKFFSSVNFTYPELRYTIIWSFLLTALAMLPTVGLMPRRLAGQRRYNYLALAPWVLTCSIKFLLNVSKQLFAIRQVTQFNDPTALTIALGIYCIIFGMATEMMLHWLAVANLLVDMTDLVLL